MECRHDHPLAVLGPQPTEDGGWVVRAWMPDAESVELLLGGQPLTMATPQDAQTRLPLPPTLATP